ncbi:ComEC/Rec2 family competence protein [Kitasatospora sp. MBT63]|uniref:ComEC/Rec2 family competence protein n=1 Tax=Kitasatospora sp. MBT63 TaxID=1444768 RepID=UPI0007C678BF|nr:ComEC/Rec2 family competence protein [Kitasatospora sp. MBT63]
MPAITLPAITPPTAALRTALPTATRPLPAADLRLLLPAVSAWAVTAAVLDSDPRRHPLLLLAAALGAALALVLLALPSRRRRQPVRLLLAATLLTGAAATTTTVLHTADLHRGPLPALADPPAVPVPASSVPDASGPSDLPPVPPDVTVELTVAGDPRSHNSPSRGTAAASSVLTVAAVVDQVRQDGPGQPRTVTTRTPVTLMVRVQDAAAWQRLVPSTRLSADVRVLPAGPGRYDTAALLLAHGPPRLLAPPALPQRVAAQLRDGLRAACAQLPPDVGGLLPGLVVGDTSHIPDDLADAFRATDLGHLTAVSGGNLAIVLAVLLGVPGRSGTTERGGLARRLGIPLRTTALLGTALTLAFVTVCRPEPSVLRAAATGLVGLLALACGRPRQALPALAGAVLVLLLWDPLLARSFGFLLSVLATSGLLTLGPRWTAALLARRWPHHLAAAAAATAAAQALCAPVTILLAPRVSLIAIPCNLLAEAAVAPATLLGFAALVVDPVSHRAAALLADLAAVPTGWLLLVARHGADLPGAELAWPAGLPGAALLAGTVLALVWAAPALLPGSAGRRPGQLRPGQLRPDRLRLDHLRPDHFCSDRRPEPRRRARLRLRLWSRHRRRPWPAQPGHRSPMLRWLPAVVCALLLPIALLRPPVLSRLATGWPPPDWRLVLCDVGQGDMTVLPVAADTAVVVDTGPDPKAADTCLRELGITRIPILILSHFHADHVEGLPGVLRGRRVGAVQTTTLDTPQGEQGRVARWSAGAGAPLLRARRGERRTAGPQLSWEVLWPDGVPGPLFPGANNASIAVLATVGPAADALRVALLGDLEPPAQAELLLRGPPLGPVHVLKVAHHGSANQDWALAAALRPRLALISCGAGNPYGHPSAYTVDRLRAQGATVLRTDRSGDIAVVGTGGSLATAVHPHPPRQ